MWFISTDRKDITRLNSVADTDQSRGFPPLHQSQKSTMQMLSCTHLCVLLVFGEAAAKKNERFHLLQKPPTTAITAKGNGSY